MRLLGSEYEEALSVVAHAVICLHKAKEGGFDQLCTKVETSGIVTVSPKKITDFTGTLAGCICLANNWFLSWLPEDEELSSRKLEAPSIICGESQDPSPCIFQFLLFSGFLYLLEQIPSGTYTL
jgi:hypothetical protein